MEGHLLLAYLLQEMTQSQLSGYIYYAVRGGKGGKLFVTQGVLCGLTYEGSPISVSELGALDITKAVILQDMPGPTTPSPDTPPVASVLQTLRNRDMGAPEPLEDPIQVTSQALSTAAAPALQPGNKDFHERAVQLIKAQLIKNLGPLGGIIVDEALRSLPGLWSTVGEAMIFVSTLSNEIDHPAEAEQFVQNTVDQLERL